MDFQRLTFGIVLGTAASKEVAGPSCNFIFEATLSRRLHLECLGFGLSLKLLNRGMDCSARS